MRKQQLGIKIYKIVRIHYKLFNANKKPQFLELAVVFNVPSLYISTYKYLSFYVRIIL